MSIRGTSYLDGTGNINKPTGTVDGDFMVCIVNGFLADPTDPTGFTKVSYGMSIAIAESRVSLYYRIASSEPSNYAIDAGFQAAMITYSANHFVGSVTNSTAESGPFANTSTDPVSDVVPLTSNSTANQAAFVVACATAVPRTINTQNTGTLSFTSDVSPGSNDLAHSHTVDWNGSFIAPHMGPTLLDLWLDRQDSDFPAVTFTQDWGGFTNYGGNPPQNQYMYYRWVPGFQVAVPPKGSWHVF